MKTILTVLTLMFAIASTASAGIMETKHNLSNNSGYNSSSESEVCVFCHTPHNASQAIGLWNRAPQTAAFKTYSGSTTLDAPTGSLTADSISRRCMSCHDGTTGLGSAVVNLPNGAITMFGSGFISGTAALGTDLGNDHPVNFRYGDVANLDSKIIPQVMVEFQTPEIKFFASAGNGGNKFAGNDYMECATCHTVHDNANGKFLVKSNGSSNLCFSCHNI